MLTRIMRPKPPLADFVEMLWYYDGYKQAHAFERILPTGTMELVIHLGGENIRVYEDGERRPPRSFGRAAICGAQTSSFVIDTAEQESILGTHFKPGGAFPFLNAPGRELRGVHVSLEDLWGREARLIVERLLQASTPELKLEILASSLLERAKTLKRRPAVLFALAELDKASDPRGTAELAQAAGLSERGFISAFLDEVGLTPKQYQRVRRFQAVIQRLRRTSKGVDWLDVALDCGYFDQSHFIHDFSAFSGFTPSDYLARRGEHLNHVPLAK